jgi:nucleoside-diphosphate-sugar epimerase
LGPIVHYLNSLDAINTSNARIRDFIQGKYKYEIPPTGTYLWVDVREVALGHVRAIEVDEAAGKRFFTLAGYLSNKAIADAIRETHPHLDDKLPPQDYPDDTPADVYGYDNKRTIEILGLKYRPLEDSVKDTVNSLLEVGA